MQCRAWIQVYRSFCTPQHCLQSLLWHHQTNSKLWRPRSSSSRIHTCTCITNHFFSLTDTTASASAILLQQTQNYVSHLGSNPGDLTQNWEQQVLSSSHHASQPWLTHCRKANRCTSTHCKHIHATLMRHTVTVMIGAEPPCTGCVDTCWSRNHPTKQQQHDILIPNCCQQLHTCQESRAPSKLLPTTAPLNCCILVSG
jgi:hypothetical protein